MTSGKNLFVHAVNMIQFGSNESIPTAIYYGEDHENLFGTEALKLGDNSHQANEDFKVDLGNVRPGQSPNTRTQFECADGKLRSAVNIANDFFEQLISHTLTNLRAKNLTPAKYALISEPLQYVAEQNEDWIENYRGNIRRILGTSFDEIQFLPEPFAVYQYYRYGIKHSLVADDRKHCALVIDFGGGTFDVSIVETTKGGDISQTGRHCRPLGANSVPTGGFEINRQVARQLAIRHFANTTDKDQLSKGITNYYRWRNGELQIEALSAVNRRFVTWYGHFLTQIESAKIQLSGTITNWSLDSTLPQAISINVPEDPFAENADEIPLRISASELREIFIAEIWNRRLKNCIKKTLEVSRHELNGRPLDLVLLSGGSSNLRWLEFLVAQEFSELLHSARIVSLRESYQEVVAKGLAIECARRGYEPNSEFSDVVYNPLFLTLEPDNRGLEKPRYRSPKGDFNLEEKPISGQLLSAADYLDIQDTCELTWKARLNHPPRRHLDYFFTKALDADGNVEDRYNYFETRVHTKASTRFGEGSIRVQLEIRQDGTCSPCFIYRTDKDDKPVDFVKGTPFVIDLVSANQSINREAFIGIDFGTATSAVSFVDWEQVEEIGRRQNDPVWLSLADLVDLPVPIAAPLKAFIGSSRVDDQAKLAMEALEGMLCFSAFVCWAEHSTFTKGQPIRINKNWKRSAGPLKKLLFDCVDARTKGNFNSAFRKELDPQFRAQLDSLISELDREKHNKIPPGSCDARIVLERLGNACRQSLTKWHFGYFEHIKKMGFSDASIGIFRIAHGMPPFHQTLEYEGPHAFSENEAVLVNIETGKAIILTPLMFWRRDNPGSIWQNCMLYDGRSRDGGAEYKTAEAHDGLSISNTEYSALESYIAGLSEGDTRAKACSDCKMKMLEEK